VLLIVVPFSLVWAAFFSYDLRNLSVALPFWALGVGIGASILGRFVTSLGAAIPVTGLGRIRNEAPRDLNFAVRKVTVLAVVGAVAIIAGSRLSSDRLRAHHQMLQRVVGNAITRYDVEAVCRRTNARSSS
jgi:hypothetical protein